MIRILRHDILHSRRLRTVAIFGGGAIALLSLDAGLKLQPLPAPAPAVTRIAVASDAAGVHNLTYYPEQLAALNSLASFTPQANAGVTDDRSTPNVAPPALAALPAAIEVKPVRRPDQKPAAARAAAASAPETDRAVRVFGVAVPGSAEVAERFSGLRDSAAHWGESAWAASGRAASFWR